MHSRRLSPFVKFYCHLITVNNRRRREMHPEQTAASRAVIHQPDGLRLRKPLFKFTNIEETNVPILVMGPENTSDFSHNSTGMLRAIVCGYSQI